MRIVIAVGEHALHKRGERGGAQTNALGVRAAAERLARIVDGNDMVVVYENGHLPGLAAAHACEMRADAAAKHHGPHADADKHIACGFELELRNCLATRRPCETLPAMIEVDVRDPAFDHPDKPIGGVLLDERAVAEAHAKHWRMASDGIGYRRVVPNPQPVRLLHLQALRRLIDEKTVVMCKGGGIPVVAGADGTLHPVEAIIDLYAGAALIAEEIGADLFVIATEMAGVFLDWGTANSKLLRHGHPSAVGEFALAAGAMGPKLRAASRFAERTGRRAAIGALAEVERLVEGSAGTTISCAGADPRRLSGGAVAR
jgi:carbamate kinase